MENALSLITQLPLTKEQQKNFVEKAKAEILSGNRDPLQIKLFLSAMTKLADEILKDEDVASVISDEVSKYPEKKFTFLGVEIEKASRKTNNFNNCGDSVYRDLCYEQELLKAKIKAREAMLLTGVDASTGETFKPPLTSITEYLKVNFK